MHNLLVSFHFISFPLFRRSLARKLTLIYGLVLAVKILQQLAEAVNFLLDELGPISLADFHAPLEKNFDVRLVLDFEFLRRA